MTGHRVALKIDVDTQRVARITIAGLVLLLCAACATGATNLLAKGRTRQVPVLIYDTAWNNPYEFPTWRMGDPIPKDELHIAVTNTGDQAIATVWLHVAHCNSQGNTELDHWLRFDGPFQPGQSYNDARATLDPDDSYLRLGTSTHLVILSIRVDDAGGAHEFHDVGKLLTSGISNFCPKL
jgi:hypothetical protein